MIERILWCIPIKTTNQPANLTEFNDKLQVYNRAAQVKHHDGKSHWFNQMKCNRHSGNSIKNSVGIIHAPMRSSSNLNWNKMSAVITSNKIKHINNYFKTPLIKSKYFIISFRLPWSASSRRFNIVSWVLRSCIWSSPNLSACLYVKEAFCEDLCSWLSRVLWQLSGMIKPMDETYPRIVTIPSNFDANFLLKSVQEEFAVYQFENPSGPI